MCTPSLVEEDKTSGTDLFPCHKHIVVGQTTKKGIDKSILLWYNIDVRKRGKQNAKGLYRK